MHTHAHPFAQAFTTVYMHAHVCLQRLACKSPLSGEEAAYALVYSHACPKIDCTCREITMHERTCAHVHMTRIPLLLTEQSAAPTPYVHACDAALTPAVCLSHTALTQPVMLYSLCACDTALTLAVCLSHTALTAPVAIFFCVPVTLHSHRPCAFHCTFTICDAARTPIPPVVLCTHEEPVVLCTHEGHVVLHSHPNCVSMN